MARLKKLMAIWIAAQLMASPALGGRPLTIDDAEPVEHGLFELEAGAFYYSESEVKHTDAMLNLAYGLFPRLEAGIGFGGQFEEREDLLARSSNVSGLGDLVLSTKGKVLTAEQAWMDHALAVSVKFPTADDGRDLGSGEIDFDLMWIASKRLGQRWGLHANLGYSWIGGSDEDGLVDVLHYGVGTDYLLSKSVQLVAELFAGSPMSRFQDTSVVLNAGARWFVRENLALDAALGAGVHGEYAPEFLATTGLTWTFGRVQRAQE